MPNGGVPLHMILTPEGQQEVVLHCHGEQLRIISKAAWDVAKADATPVAVLSAQEGKVLARFLRYWLHDTGDGPLYRERGVNAQFDF